MTDRELEQKIRAAFEADKPRQQKAAEEIAANVSKPKRDLFLEEKAKAAREGRLL